MKTVATLITAILLTLASGSSADAHSRTHAVSVRIDYASVQLTPREIQALRVEQAQIKRFKRQAMRDGFLNKRESLQLRAMNKAFARQVRNFKYNRARRL